MVQVLLEEGVIGRDAWDVRTLREAHPRVVRNERRVDVDQIHVPEPCAFQRAVQGRPTHAPIFRISRNARRGHADDGLIGLILGPSVLRRDEQGLDATIGEICAKSANRRRDAVDAGEIDV